MARHEAEMALEAIAQNSDTPVCRKCFNENDQKCNINEIPDSYQMGT
jgi:hypothetical protein